MKTRTRSRWFFFRKNLPLTIMALPGIILMILFKYLPLSGIVLAFKQYNIRDGIFGSAWNGLKNFEYLFRTKDAWIITRNTLAYNLVFLFSGNAWGNPANAVDIALLSGTASGAPYDPLSALEASNSDAVISDQR